MKLIELNQLNIDNFIELLRDSELLVIENILGSKIFFTYENDEFIIKPRSLDNTPLSKIDLALQKYYQPLVDYLNSLDDRIKKLLPKKYWFACEFFCDNKPSHATYDRLPKNNLILTAIIKPTKNVFNYAEICEFANLLDIDSIPIIYSGKLTDKQLQLIKLFLSTSEKDLEFIFGEDNFTSFFYKILNPQLENSFLCDTYQENLDKIIIKIAGDIEMSFSILNPIHKTNVNKNTDFTDVYTILIIDFVEFCQVLNYDEVRLKSNTFDSLYLELISAMFNVYCDRRNTKIINFDFDIPPFFHEEKYRLNVDLITNEKTKEWIHESYKIEYLFRILLSAFRYKKKTIVGVFTENTLNAFNDLVNTIHKTINKKLKISRDIALNGNLLNFGDFYKISYPSDGENKVYPDLFKPEEDDNVVNTKKKSKK